MHVLKAKLTVKFQATIPKEVRNVLHLKAQDQIIYEITDDKQVILRKATPFDIDYLQALNYTLSEWDSDDDEKAYKNL
jgi:AbrB family looped-hinge helix DNA binding protein